VFVTYHLVEGDEDRRDIFSRLNPGGIWDSGAVELMAIAQAEDVPLAFVVSASLGPRISKLTHWHFPSEPERDETWLHLLDYLAWEINGLGKSFLLLDNPASLGPLARCLRDTGLDLAHPLAVKLGDEGFLGLLEAGG